MKKSRIASLGAGSSNELQKFDYMTVHHGNSPNNVVKVIGPIGWGLVNSSPPSAAYMRQWTRSALLQIMACRLIRAKPLSKPMLGYRQLDPWEETSVKF